MYSLTCRYMHIHKHRENCQIIFILINKFLLLFLVVAVSAEPTPCWHENGRFLVCLANITGLFLLNITMFELPWINLEISKCLGVTE